MNKNYLRSNLNNTQDKGKKPLQNVYPTFPNVATKRSMSQDINAGGSENRDATPANGDDENPPTAPASTKGYREDAYINKHGGCGGTFQFLKKQIRVNNTLSSFELQVLVHLTLPSSNLNTKKKQNAVVVLYNYFSFNNVYFYIIDEQYFT